MKGQGLCAWCGVIGQMDQLPSEEETRCLNDQVFTHMFQVWTLSETNSNK